VRNCTSAVVVSHQPNRRVSLAHDVDVTGGQVPDVNLLDELRLEAGAFCLLDRG